MVISTVSSISVRLNISPPKAIVVVHLPRIGAEATGSNRSFAMVVGWVVVGSVMGWVSVGFVASSGVAGRVEGVSAVAGGTCSLPQAANKTVSTTNSSAKAFFTVHEDKNGHLCHYIDRRFIIGNYSTDTGLIELNEHFEPEINGDFKVELDERLKRAKDETKERHEEFGKLYARHNNGAPEAEGESADDMEEWSDGGWD